MKSIIAVAAILIATLSFGQATVPPPVIVIPAITNWVTKTNVVVTTTPVVVTNAYIREVTIAINTNQDPSVFIIKMNDGSTIVAKAKDIPTIVDPTVRGLFNGLLAQAIANGTHYPAGTNRVHLGK